MPIYTFRCEVCNNTQEEVASVSGETVPSVKCSACGSRKLRKIPSVPGPPRGGDTPKFHGGGE